jgi:hypothetical protein
MPRRLGSIEQSAEIMGWLIAHARDRASFVTRRMREARRIATATYRSTKAKAAELRSAAKAQLDPKLPDSIASKACAL